MPFNGTEHKSPAGLRRKEMRKFEWRKMVMVLAAAAVFGTAAGGTVVAGNYLTDRYLGTESADAGEASSEVTEKKPSATSIIMAEPVYDAEEEIATAGSDTADTAAAETENAETYLAANDGSGTQYSVADVAEEAMPSMVAITSTSVARTRWFFGGQGMPKEEIGAQSISRNPPGSPSLCVSAISTVASAQRSSIPAGS